jgi:hypothetical protein
MEILKTYRSLWNSYANLKEIYRNPKKSYGNPMGIIWKSYRNPMEITWNPTKSYVLCFPVLCKTRFTGCRGGFTRWRVRPSSFKKHDRGSVFTSVSSKNEDFQCAQNAGKVVKFWFWFQCACELQRQFWQQTQIYETNKKYIRNNHFSKYEKHIQQMRNFA